VKRRLEPAATETQQADRGVREAAHKLRLSGGLMTFRECLLTVSFYTIPLSILIAIIVWWRQ
jgi:hypothetical protein